MVLNGCRKDFSEQPSYSVTSYTGAENLITDSDNYIATSWMTFEVHRIIKSSATYAPPITARAIGYTGITMYEIMRNGTPGHASLVGQLSGLKSLPKPDTTLSYRWSVACNAATAHLIRYLFDNMSAPVRASLDSLETANNNLLGNTTADDFVRSVAYGVNLADSIIEWSKPDGGDHGYTTLFPKSYQPPVGLQYWIPTETQGAVPLLPYWGNNHSFVKNDVSITQPSVGPLPYSTSTRSSYYKSANDVYVTGINLTDEQKTIASFWNDGSSSITPPGHSASILTDVIKDQNLGLFEATRAYARMGITLNDVFISCWKTKYTYVAVRPWTYIRANIDSSWVPYIPTPPHPEFTAGHSTQSGAASTILNALFGSATAFTDHSHDEDGFASRSFASFTDFANEAALSRVYGGIHYRRTVQLGLKQGRAVALQVLQLNL